MKDEGGRMKRSLAMLILIMALAGCTPGLGPTPTRPDEGGVSLTPVPENAFVRGAGSATVASPVQGLYGAAGDTWWVDAYRLGETELAWMRVYLDRPLSVEPLAYVSVRGTPTLIGDGLNGLAVSDWERLRLARATIEQACAAAIRENAAAIQSVNLGPLAHPGYAESTSAWRPDAAALSSPQPALMAVNADRQQAICRWQGPTLPAVKPLVTRWLVLYPVYDLQAGRVTRIVVTIEGQLEE
jgi:hypothetical protein